jgi:hypothetical protein
MVFLPRAKPIARRQSAVPIIEHYPSGAPRVPIRRTVERLLAGTNDRCLIGLGRVVLTNSSDLASDQKKPARGHRSGRRVLGGYHPAWKGEPARIELYVDHILEGQSRWSMWIPPAADLVLGDVLFHEVGHHVHRVRRPERRGAELVAEDWAERLQRDYFGRRYWYLRLALWPCFTAWRLVTRLGVQRHRA